MKTLTASIKRSFVFHLFQCKIKRDNIGPNSVFKPPVSHFSIFDTFSRVSNGGSVLFALPHENS
jgi:hypothetical protein